MIRLKTETKSAKPWSHKLLSCVLRKKPFFIINQSHTLGELICSTLNLTSLVVRCELFFLSQVHENECIMHSVKMIENFFVLFFVSLLLTLKATSLQKFECSLFCSKPQNFPFPPYPENSFLTKLQYQNAVDVGVAALCYIYNL